MDEITTRVIAALQQAGIAATTQFPVGFMPRLAEAAAAVELQSIRAASGSFLDYLGITEDPEKGPLERYGRKMEGTVLVRICAPDAASVRTAAETAVSVLGVGLKNVTVEETAAEETVFDQAADCFRKDVLVRFSAYFCALRTEDDTEFLDFKLEGEIR